MAGSPSSLSSVVEKLDGISIGEGGLGKSTPLRGNLSKDLNGSNGTTKPTAVAGGGSASRGLSPSQPALSREAMARSSTVKRKKDFKYMERVNGKMVNVLEGLELHTGVFDEAEQKKIVDYVHEIQEKGRRGQLRERTYSEPRKWMRGKGRVTIQFGCCYNYAPDKDGNPPGIVQDEEVDPIPPLLKSMIKRMVVWHVLPQTCIPNSCIINIYDKDDCIPPHIDHHDFLRPFCTVSFLTECNILFGKELKVLGPGEFSGSSAISLPLGSVLILSGNGADVAKHCVPAVPAKRISITFRKMDDGKLPFRFTPDPELTNFQSLPCPSNRHSIHPIFNQNVSDSPLQKESRNLSPSLEVKEASTYRWSGSSRERSNGEKEQLDVNEVKPSSTFQLGTDDFPPLGLSQPKRRPERPLKR